MLVGEEIIVSSFWGDVAHIQGMAGTIIKTSDVFGRGQTVRLTSGEVVNLHVCEMICLTTFTDTYEVD
jgi:hypothetical protein